jgi:hypothetical protein
MLPSSKSGSVEVDEIGNPSHALQVLVLTLSPVIAIIGAYFTKLRWQTALFACFYYGFTCLSEQARRSH